MDSVQSLWKPRSGWNSGSGPLALPGASLVLVFGGREALECSQAVADVRAAYPDATIAGCSTAGEIHGTAVLSDTVVATAVRFAQSRVTAATVTIGDGASSFDVGKQLGEVIAEPGLVHVLVFSDGLLVNGSQLVRGLTAGLPKDVSVTGGLAGDGPHFERTLVVAGERLEPGMVTAVGLHGDSLRVGYGSLGGWDPFGPVRLVTRSDGNILHELDGRSALDLYKLYLGDHACDLPGSGLLFPLSLKTEDGERSVVRTVLSVDEANGSMTFAGDIPEGGSVQLMKANFDRLIDGATGAAEHSRTGIGTQGAELAILISCVGRRMVLDQRVEDETEAVLDVVGESATLAGFYSYGEIAAFVADGTCELHNQTMTVTTLTERADR